MGRKRLHGDYWILKVTSNTIWVSNYVGDVITLKLDDPQLVADWLEGRISDENLIDPKIIEELEKSRLLLGEFWDLKLKYNDVHFIIPDEFVSTLEFLLKSKEIRNSIRFSLEKPETPSKETLYVYVQNSIDNNQISKFDDWASKNNATWLPIGLMELARLSFGPVIIPFKTPCLECYFSRRKANGNSVDVNLRLGFEEINHPTLRTHEFTLLVSLLLTRIQLGIEVFVQHQSAVVTSFNRMGLDHVDDELFFAPRCSRCSQKKYPIVEPHTPMPKEMK